MQFTDPLQNKKSSVNSFPDGKNIVPKENDLFRLYCIIMIVWGLLWTLLPCFCIGNIPIDVSENVAWGHHFEFGYDKNPYFGAWLTHLLYKVFKADWISYLASQISVVSAMICVYFLGKRIFRNTFHAVLAGLLLLLIPFFSHSANEFNDDVIEIGLWAATALFFHRAVITDRKACLDWILTGFFAGLSLMTKYLAGVLFLPLGLLLLLTPEGRRCWKNPYMYAGLFVFILLVTPNVIWLFQHDFIAFSYALGRANISGKSTFLTLAGFLSALKTLATVFVYFILPTLFLLISFKNKGKNTVSPFDRIFLWMTAAGPTVITLLFAIFSGGQILRSWLTPYFIFTGLFLVMLWNPQPDKRRFHIFLTGLCIFTVIAIYLFGHEYLYKRPYQKKSWNYTTYPGRECAEIISAEWENRYKVPLKYVIAPRTEACNMYYYSKNPPEVFFDGNLHLSPWINMDDVKKAGGVMIWTNPNPHQFFEAPLWWKDIPRTNFRTLTMKRSAVSWFKYFAGDVRRDIKVYVMDIPPESHRKK